MSQVKNDKSEILHYDNPEFPVFVRKNYIPKDVDFKDVSIHWHDEVEFIYVLRGDIGYLIDGKRITLCAGEGVFVNSRHLHRILNGSSDCELLCLIFSPLLLCTSHFIVSKMVMPIIAGDLPYLVLKERYSWQREILNSVYSIYNSSLQEGEELEVIAHICRMWKLLVQNVITQESRIVVEDDDLMQVKAMLGFIQSNYAEAIALRDICVSGSMGKNRCTTLFKKYTNMSPVDYLRYYRIEKSLELLRGTDKTITEIAYETGFSGASYFAETFRKYIGCSPLQFREKARE